MDTMKKGWCSVKYPSVRSNFIHDGLNQSFWERQAITWSHDGGDSSSIHFQTSRVKMVVWWRDFLIPEILLYFSLIFVLVDGWWLDRRKSCEFSLTIFPCVSFQQ